jgi:serine phosphatase RsbU (regulator of sigma subunit)
MAGALLALSAAVVFQAGSVDARAAGAPLVLPSLTAAPAAGAPVLGVSPTALSLPSLSLSVPSLTVSVPSVTVSLPGVSVSTPSVSVSTPQVSASGSGASVTLPSATVSVPSVTTPVASTPPVTVTTPPVTVTTPSVPKVSTPSPPATPGSPAGEGSSTPTSGGGSSRTAAGSSSSSGAGSQGATSSPASTRTPAAQAAIAPTVGDRTQAASLGTRGRSASERRARRAADGAPTGTAAAVTLLPTADVDGRPAAETGEGVTQAASAKSSDPLSSIGRHIPLPIPVPDWSKPIIALLLVLAIGFGVRSSLAVARARRLERQRATLQRDLDVMQMALVPTVPSQVGGLGVSVAYRPADGPAAGGDFYDVFVPEAGKVAIILGDVAGHGHGALEQAALTRYTLRAYVQAGLEPRAALALAGRVLADPSVEHYATVAVAVYDSGEGTLTYALAGHPPPLLSGCETHEHVVACSSPPLGWTAPTGSRQTTIALPRGATMCFFSDGLIEARCGDDLLGAERLGEMFSSLGTQPQAGELLARVSSTATATPDDMAACVLVSETTGAAGTHGHVEELEVDAQALDRGQVGRFLGGYGIASAEAAQALEVARDIAGAFGTAMLRVELREPAAKLTVTTGGGNAAPGVEATRLLGLSS